MDVLPTLNLAFNADSTNDIVLVADGGHGQVFSSKPKDTTGPPHTALKVLVKKLNSDWTEERNIWKKMTERGHPNILPLIRDDDLRDIVVFSSPYMVMDLNDYISSENAHPNVRDTTISIAMGIADGLGFMHDMRIGHMDIKPENILLDHDGVAKITDFGLSLEFGPELTQSSIKGTAFFTSLEKIFHSAAYDKIDMWALGVTLMELFCGPMKTDCLNPNYIEPGTSSEVLSMLINGFGSRAILECKSLTNLPRFDKRFINMTPSRHIPLFRFREGVYQVEEDIKSILEQILVLDYTTRPSAQEVSSALKNLLLGQGGPWMGDDFDMLP